MTQKILIWLLWLLPLPVVGQTEKVEKAGESARPGPRLVIDALEHDLGGVKRSDGAEHTFKFRNEGTSDLEILRVAPS